MTMLTGLLKTLAGRTVHEAASPGLKPLPVIITLAPGEALFGVNVRDGELLLMMKVADAESPVPPVTVTVTVPAATLPTLKLVAVSIPAPVIVQVLGPISDGMLPVIMHVPASFCENPAPVMITPDP